MPLNIHEAVQESINRDQALIAAEISDTQLKIVTATFEKSTAYTNLMLLRGYAGFFGLWQLAKKFLSKQQVVLWATLLVLISLGSFIVFEVAKMIVITNLIQKNAAFFALRRRDPIKLNC